MSLSYRSFAVLKVLALLMLAAASASAADSGEFFESRIRPLFAKHCFACHTQTKMGGLELSSRDALLRGGGRGPAIEPRAPERSLLIQAVRYEHEQIKMPPAGKLEEKEIEDLVAWVDGGAVWPEGAEKQNASSDDGFVVTEEHRRFWAFQEIEKTEPPLAAGASTPIDRFLAAKLREKALEPAPPADRRTLLRRAYFDLIGLPPTPEETDAFLADASGDAFAQVVERLLASPRYGERWGRYWLDVARYSDDRLNSTQDEPYPNAFRYRDWVIKAFNDDMPYDLFVKAQIAGDQLPEGERHGRSADELVGGLGFYGLSPKFQDERIDATGRGFMALTIGCAQCHDHKFDPIPTEDYYALLGVFNSTEVDEHPLAPAEVVAAYEVKKKLADKEEAKLKAFLATQAGQLVDALAQRTADYLTAAWRVASKPEGEIFAAARESGLDAETLQRWVDYLSASPKEQPLLDRWQELLHNGATEDAVRLFAQEAQALILRVIAEKKRVDRENEIRLGGEDSARNRNRVEMLSLPRDEFFLWRDVASGSKRELPSEAESGIFHYKDDEIERFLDGVWKSHVDDSRKRVEMLRADTPEKYPFQHIISDIEKPRNEHVYIRGNQNNLGDEAPRRFLSILCEGEPEPFTRGSGRLELAEAIASPNNPLTARVMMNRVWLQHFGRGIVGTPSNFGQMGERPSHPGLLDYLASRFIASGWSIKVMHREIMLSDGYARSSEEIATNSEIDGNNRFLWRYNRRRMDVEALRDTLLQVAGLLDLEAGGPPVPLVEAENHRRTVYGFVSRRRLDSVLGLFDFPNPNNTSPRRIATDTPLQGLFFLNSKLVMTAAEALAARLGREAQEDGERIDRVYRLLYGRAPSELESSLSRDFLRENADGWPKLAQVLLSSNEFLYVE